MANWAAMVREGRWHNLGAPVDQILVEANAYKDSAGRGDKTSRLREGTPPASEKKPYFLGSLSPPTPTHHDRNLCCHEK
jgi:hypothetical protein